MKEKKYTGTTEEKNRLITKICQMYYIDDMNQQEISERVNISRSQISKLIKQGKEKGIVSISINSKYSEENQYSNELIQKYGLRDAVVADTTGMSLPDAFNRISFSFNSVFDRLLKDDDIVGVMAGQSVNRLTSTINVSYRNNVSIYPLVGGFGPKGEDWQANSNAKAFADRLKGTCYQFNCPAYVGDENLRNALMAQKDIQYLYKLGQKTDIAIVSVGQMGSKSTLLNAGILDNDALIDLTGKKVVSSVCASFLDENGDEVNCIAANRMVGCSIRDLKKMKNVIAVAYGNSKVEAITAALKGNWFNILVTDLNTAKQICNK